MTLTTPLPKNFTPWPELILGNFSGRINYQVAEQIKNRARFSEFSAWGVSGKIWWNEKSKQWCSEVWKKATLLDCLSAQAIEDLVFTIEKQYGWK